MTDDNQPKTGELLIYRDESGDVIRVLLEGETVWLTQRLMADLYQVGVNTINHHVKSIYREGELAAGATIRQYRIVQTEGARRVERLVDHYNLDTILAVGYRVRSPRGTQFRQWATARLSEYLIKGFTLDDERLKGNTSPVDYFDELLARIRDIRASEARVYQRIRDIFALASDYSEGEQHTQRFFATVQNKMHYAATGQTAAEIVRQRADAEQPNMGLTNWKGGQVIKRDVANAKNYLDDQEIDTLNRITVMFLDQAEFRAMRRQDIRMADWEAFLDTFLTCLYWRVPGALATTTPEAGPNCNMTPLPNGGEWKLKKNPKPVTSMTCADLPKPWRRSLSRQLKVRRQARSAVPRRRGG